MSVLDAVEGHAHGVLGVRGGRQQELDDALDVVVLHDGDDRGEVLLGSGERVEVESHHRRGDGVAAPERLTAVRDAVRVPCEVVERARERPAPQERGQRRPPVGTCGHRLDERGRERVRHAPVDEHDVRCQAVLAPGMQPSGHHLLGGPGDVRVGADDHGVVPGAEEDQGTGPPDRRRHLVRRAPPAAQDDVRLRGAGSGQEGRPVRAVHLHARQEVGELRDDGEEDVLDGARGTHDDAPPLDQGDDAEESERLQHGVGRQHDEDGRPRVIVRARARRPRGAST
ncbi:hypothetical protein BC477_00810 [Clavibacter michiganensis subsp. michiganensis]|uniref:Uncharacterized protein n=1 Tax=Clavibacter michiganensis subsp. michiganensis TaxID=33013 RepID=A0A251XFR5_CLAMM|nr:hypothetical protein BC477_00810 [Clavibacter michiganensis subsp. michiganensis]OUE00884.1 hypothetical protein CMMCAS07_15710 [Clavibacter michiganensis subsp. michiganensis]